MTIVFPIVFAVVDSLYWTIFKARDMRIPPKYWAIVSTVTLIGAVLGAQFLAPVLTSGTQDLLTSTLGALAGSRLANVGLEMLNPQLLPPAQRN